MNYQTHRRVKFNQFFEKYYNIYKINKFLKNPTQTNGEKLISMHCVFETLPLMMSHEECKSRKECMLKMIEGAYEGFTDGCNYSVRGPVIEHDSLKLINLAELYTMAIEYREMICQKT